MKRILITGSRYARPEGNHLAFPMTGKTSRGTLNCMSLARQAGIQTITTWLDES